MTVAQIAWERDQRWEVEPVVLDLAASAWGRLLLGPTINWAANQDFGVIQTPIYERKSNMKGNTLLLRKFNIWGTSMRILIHNFSFEQIVNVWQILAHIGQKLANIPQIWSLQKHQRNLPRFFIFAKKDLAVRKSCRWSLKLMLHGCLLAKFGFDRTVNDPSEAVIIDYSYNF